MGGPEGSPSRTLGHPLVPARRDRNGHVGDLSGLSAAASSITTRSPPWADPSSPPQVHGRDLLQPIWHDQTQTLRTGPTPRNPQPDEDPPGRGRSASQSIARPPARAGPPQRRG